MDKVLVVDDEGSVLQTMETNLRARGYGVELAVTGAGAMDLVAREMPDAIILDLGLPDMDGVDVVRGLREWTEVPIIIMSARSAEPDKVAALDAGANDYVTKPFGIDELMARLRAAVRGSSAKESHGSIKTADFTIDLAAKRVDRHGENVRLTATEWKLVELLARNAGRLIGQRELLDEVWGAADIKSAGNNYVRVFMRSIRRKLEPEPASPRYFITEPGSGIRFVPQGRAGSG